MLYGPSAVPTRSERAGPALRLCSHCQACTRAALRRAPKLTTQDCPLKAEHGQALKVCILSQDRWVCLHTQYLLSASPAPIRDMGAAGRNKGDCIVHHWRRILFSLVFKKGPSVLSSPWRPPSVNAFRLLSFQFQPPRLSSAIVSVASTRGWFASCPRGSNTFYWKN